MFDTKSIVCPVCLSELNYNDKVLICANTDCMVEYYIIDNIPNLIVEEANTRCPRCNNKREWNNIEKFLYCRNCNFYVGRNNNN